MRKPNIPIEYLDTVKELDVPMDIGIELYHRKAAKKNWDYLVHRYARDYDIDYHVAKRALKKCWGSFVQKTHSGQCRTTTTGTAEETILEKAREELQKLIGRFKRVDKRPQDRSDRTLLLAGDFHIPFTSKKALEALMSEDATDLAIMGDYFDMYSASRYRPEQINYCTIAEELATGRAIMEELSKKFDRVFFLRGGNHDVRPLRRVQEVLPQIMPLIVHPLDLISGGLPNVSGLGKCLSQEGIVGSSAEIEIDFFSQLGSMILGHFENFCGADAPKRVDDWLGSWSHVLQLESGVNLVAQAHTHRLSFEFSPKGKALIGTGCLALPQAYQIYGHGRYTPPTLGYVRLETDRHYRARTDSVRLIRGEDW